MSLKTRTPRLAITTLSMALALTLAACGDGDTDASPSSSPEATGTIAPPEASSPDQVTTTVAGLADIPQSAADAKAFVEELSTVPSTIVWDQPLTKPIPEGKTIAVLELGVPAVVAIDNWIEEAAEDVGWSIRRIQAGVTAETFKAAMEEAVRMKPDAVMLTSFPREVYEAELKQLEAMKVPVVGLTVSSDTGGALIATLAGGPRYVRWGQVMAAQVAAASGGKDADTLVTLVPEYSTSAYVQEGFKEAYPVLCPGCKYDILDFGGADIGTKVPGEIVSYLQAHPNVKYLSMFGTFMGTGVVPALRAAGILDRLTIFTHDLDPPAAQDIKDGVDMTVYSAAAAEMAYRGVDILVRYLSDDPTWKDSARTGLPEWIAAKDTVPTEALDDFIPSVPGFQDQYKKLWGLS